MTTSLLAAPTTTPHKLPWLFSARVDVATFLGSALVALALVALGAWQGWLQTQTPEWSWVGAVLLVDVAHVYATAFRVYFVPSELRRRPWLYLLTPLIALGLGIALYSESQAWFWRVLAYLAVFHFVRQQYGWVALYRAKASERDRLGYWIDTIAIYAATLFPLCYWHAHLPREYWWFIKDDFIALPKLIVTLTAPLYVLALASYFIYSVYRGLARGHWNPGKDIIVATTALCWYVGIVALNSDFAFMVTNVIVHGVPYMVLIYWYNIRQREPAKASVPGQWRLLGAWRGLLIFLATVWLLAYLEELAWDRTVNHDRAWLFGPAWPEQGISWWLAPLLAVPQITHYVLDGFIWRRRSNPDVASQVVSGQ